MPSSSDGEKGPRQRERRVQERHPLPAWCSSCTRRPGCLTAPAAGLARGQLSRIPPGGMKIKSLHVTSKVPLSTGDTAPCCPLNGRLDTEKVPDNSSRRPKMGPVETSPSWLVPLLERSPK